MDWQASYQLWLEHPLMTTMLRSDLTSHYWCFEWFIAQTRPLERGSITRENEWLDAYPKRERPKCNIHVWIYCRCVARLKMHKWWLIREIESLCVAGNCDDAFNHSSNQSSSYQTHISSTIVVLRSHTQILFRRSVLHDNRRCTFHCQKLWTG